MKLAQIVEEGPLEGRSEGLKNPPQRAHREKRRESYDDLKSQGDSKSVASSKRRVSPHRAHSSVNLRETLNAKQNQEGDL